MLPGSRSIMVAPRGGQLEVDAGADGVGTGACTGASPSPLPAPLTPSLAPLTPSQAAPPPSLQLLPELALPPPAAGTGTAASTPVAAQRRRGCCCGARAAVWLVTAPIAACRAWLLPYLYLLPSDGDTREAAETWTGMAVRRLQVVAAGCAIGAVAGAYNLAIDGFVTAPGAVGVVPRALPRAWLIVEGFATIYISVSQYYQIFGWMPPIRNAAVYTTLMGVYGFLPWRLVSEFWLWDDGSWEQSSAPAFARFVGTLWCVACYVINAAAITRFVRGASSAGHRAARLLVRTAMAENDVRELRRSATLVAAAKAKVRTLLLRQRAAAAAAGTATSARTSRKRRLSSLLRIGAPATSTARADGVSPTGTGTPGDGEGAVMLPTTTLDVLTSREIAAAAPTTATGLSEEQAAPPPTGTAAVDAAGHSDAAPYRLMTTAGESVEDTGTGMVADSSVAAAAHAAHGSVASASSDTAGGADMFAALLEEGEREWRLGVEAPAHLDDMDGGVMTSDVLAPDTLPPSPAMHVATEADAVVGPTGTTSGKGPNTDAVVVPVVVATTAPPSRDDLEAEVAHAKRRMRSLLAAVRRPQGARPPTVCTSVAVLFLPVLCVWGTSWLYLFAFFPYWYQPGLSLEARIAMMAIATPLWFAVARGGVRAATMRLAQQNPATAWTGLIMLAWQSALLKRILAACTPWPDQVRAALTVSLVNLGGRLLIKPQNYATQWVASGCSRRRIPFASYRLNPVQHAMATSFVSTVEVVEAVTTVYANAAGALIRAPSQGGAPAAAAGDAGQNAALPAAGGAACHPRAAAAAHAHRPPRPPPGRPPPRPPSSRRPRCPRHRRCCLRQPAGRGFRRRRRRHLRPTTSSGGSWQTAWCGGGHETVPCPRRPRHFHRRRLPRRRPARAVRQTARCLPCPAGWPSARPPLRVPRPPQALPLQQPQLRRRLWLLPPRLYARAAQRQRR